MRLIRLKINEAVEHRLKLLAAETVQEPDFVIDAYALIVLDGCGIPSEKRQDLLAKKLAAKLSSDLSARILVRKRAQTLKQLTKLVYFKALCALPDKLKSVERMLRRFVIVGKLNRRSECMSCSYYASCDFGQQYAQTVSSISKVIDPDYKKKVHQDCPSLPDLDRTNAINEAIKFMAQLTDPNNAQNNQLVATTMQSDRPGDPIDPNAFDGDADDADSEETEEDKDLDPASLDDDAEDYERTVGRMSKGNGKFSATFTADYFVRTQEQLIDSLTKGGMELFKISEQLGQLLQSGHSTSYNPTPAPADKKKVQTIKSVSDVGDVNAIEHTLPDEVFDSRLAKKSLKVDKNQEPAKKRQLLYLILDVSASMKTQYSQHTGIISRASFARLVSSAMVKKVRDDGGIVYLRFFDSWPSPLTAMRQKEDFDDILEKLKVASFNGGGTNIYQALKVATDDIRAAKDELSRAEILMITDAEDRLTNFPTNLFDDIGFNVLDVSGSRGSHFSYPDMASTVLKKHAKRYYKADEAYIDLRKIVALV